MFIADTTGADTPITVGARDSTSTRDFTAGAGILGERRCIGESGHGVGEERRGGASMADGGILIRCMPLRTSGLLIT